MFPLRGEDSAAVPRNRARDFSSIIRKHGRDVGTGQSAPQVQRRTSETHEKKKEKTCPANAIVKKQKNGVDFSSTSRKA